MKLDVEALGRDALADARRALEPQAKKLGERGVILLARFGVLEHHVQATLAALEAAQDEHTAAALREDLEQIIPARRAALLSAVEAELGSATKATLDALLEVGVRVALVVARAFVPLP